MKNIRKTSGLKWGLLGITSCMVLMLVSKMYNDHNTSEIATCDMLTLENALAIGDVLPNCYSKQECQSKSGVWDAYSKCINGGIITGEECKVSGELTIAGFTVKGAYEKGKKYSGSWSLYSCENKEGNCCIEQGIQVSA